MSYIYLVTNNINGKQYVGQHKYHKSGIDSSYKGSGVLLRAAYEKYGIENFTMELLEECSNEDMNPLEQLYIEQYNTLTPNGYNICEGGGIYDTISHHPNKEDIIRRSTEGNIRFHKEHPDILKGEKNPMYGKGYLIAGEKNGWYGKHHTEEMKKHLSEVLSGENNPQYGKTGELASCYGRCGEKHPMFGKHHTEEAKKRISEAEKGVPRRNEHILQIDPYTNEIVKEWDNTTQIERETDYRKNTITSIAVQNKTKCKTAYGYRWLWKSDYDYLIENGLELPKHYEKGELNKMPIVQIDIKTKEVIKEWPSAADIKKELGFSNTAILRCAKGEYTSSNGFIWMYKDDYLENGCDRTVKRIKRKVQQFTMDGIFVAEYDSPMEAAEKNGFAFSNIYACCGGQKKAYKNHIWKYAA